MQAEVHWYALILILFQVILSSVGKVFKQKLPGIMPKQLDPEGEIIVSGVSCGKVVYPRREVVCNALDK